jgi:hypothetical protein
MTGLDVCSPEHSIYAKPCYRQLIKPESNSTPPTVHAIKVLQSLTGAVYHGSKTAK